MTNQQTDVLAVIEKMTADFQRGAIDAVMSAYERDAIVLFEPGVLARDAKAIRQTFTEWMALKPEFTYSGHEVYVASDLAVHIAPWSMTGTAPDGSAIRQDGLSVAVLCRRGDGSWRIVIDNPHGARLLATATTAIQTAGQATHGCGWPHAKLDRGRAQAGGTVVTSLPQPPLRAFAALGLLRCSIS